MSVGPLCFQFAQSFCLFRYAIAWVWGLRVILFAAFSRFCPLGAIASWACALATPNRRFMVPKHCTTRKRRFEISLLKRRSDARSGRPQAAVDVVHGSPLLLMLLLVADGSLLANLLLRLHDSWCGCYLDAFQIRSITFQFSYWPAFASSGRRPP